MSEFIQNVYPTLEVVVATSLMASVLIMFIILVGNLSGDENK